MVALDPHRGYANGLLAHLGHATVVIDHFHAVVLANRAIDDVRRRVQNDTLGHRGPTGDPLYGIRRLLLVGGERLSDRGRQRIMDGLAAGDPDGEVGASVLGKELLREVYAAVDLARARRRLVAFYQWCAQAQVPELTRLATTISKWQTEVLAYHTTGASNGPTEHDMPLILSISDRVYCLESGVVIAEGAPRDVRNDPVVIASYLGTDERAIPRSDAPATVEA